MKISIRYGTLTDLSQIRSLWEISFPEEPKFNDVFFNDFFRVETALLYIKNNEICSMLQMIPYTLEFENKFYPVQYIYGACTHPKYQRQGIMGKLLQFAAFEGNTKGEFASILIPQENKLFRMYNNFGYQTGFFIHKNELSFENPFPHTMIKEAHEVNIDDINRLYQFGTKNCKGRIVRNHSYWRKQIELFKKVGGKTYCLLQEQRLVAYGFIFYEKNQLYLQEAFGESDETLVNFAHQVASKEGFRKISILSSNIGQDKKVPLGCIKFLQDTCPKDFTGYMNLMFN